MMFSPHMAMLVIVDMVVMVDMVVLVDQQFVLPREINFDRNKMLTKKTVDQFFFDQQFCFFNLIFLLNV